MLVPKRTTARRCGFSLFLMVAALLTIAQTSRAAVPPAQSTRITILPAISRPSVKNGDSVTISALVSAPRGMRRVEAMIVSKKSLDKPGSEADHTLPGEEQADALPVQRWLAHMELQPAACGTGGISEDQTRGLWTTQWMGTGLEEGYYRVVLRVTDRTGETREDSSLVFSDPIAGNDTPGTPDYPNGALQATGATMRLQNIGRTLVDPVTNYAYVFGTTKAFPVPHPFSNAPIGITKLAPNFEFETPRVLGMTDLSVGDYVDSILDPKHGYGYVITQSRRATVFSFGTGEALPSELGTSQANFGDRFLNLDAPGNLLYVMQDVFLAKFKLSGGNVPTLVQSIWMIDPYTGGLLDTAAGYNYVCSETHARIVKVALDGKPTGPNGSSGMGVASSLNLIGQASGFRPIRIDPAAKLAWFVSIDVPAKIVKLALGTGDAAPTLVSYLTLDGAYGAMQSVIDLPGTRYALIANHEAASGRIFKIDLGAGTTSPTLLGSLQLGAEEAKLVGGGYAPGAASALYASGNTGKIIKINPGAGSSAPERFVATESTLPLDQVRLILTDPFASYALLVTERSSGYAEMQKVDLGDATTMPKPVAPPYFIPGGQDKPLCGVLDATGNYAYISFDHNPGVIAKYAMGGMHDPIRNVGARFFEVGEQAAISAVIDRERNQAWFGTNQSPGRVIKMALGSGDTLPTRLGAVSFDSGEAAPFTAVIDPPAGYAYFGTNNNPGRIVKVALGEGAAPPQRISALELQTGEGYPYSSVIHPFAGYALFGTYTTPGRIVKVGLGAGNAPPTRIGAVQLEPGENQPASALLDPLSGRAYFGTLSSPGKVVSIGAGAEAAPPTRLGSVTMDPGHNNLYGAFLNAQAGTAVFASFGNLSTLNRLLISQQGKIQFTPFTMPEKGSVEALAFYSHIGIGKVRLALYQQLEPTYRELLWQSESTTNTSNNELLEIPIHAGTPDSLTLYPGNYFWAWQVDTTANVPSLGFGATGDGSYLIQNDGAFPASLSSQYPATRWTETNQIWTGFIRYKAETQADPIWLGVGQEAY